MLWSDQNSEGVEYPSGWQNTVTEVTEQNFCQDFGEAARNYDITAGTYGSPEGRVTISFFLLIHFLKSDLNYFLNS